LQARRSETFISFASPPLLHAWPSGGSYFGWRCSQRFDIQHRFGQQSPELRILRFEVPQPLRIGHRHAAEFGASGIKRLVAEAVPQAWLSPA
jgi:hypothetical protein